MWFNDHEQAADHIYNNDPRGNPDAHEAKWTHEAVGFGAGFVAMREYEKRQEQRGEHPKHGTAKEVIAGIAGAEVDKLFETKGLDFLDRERAKHRAREEAERLYEQRYN